MEERPEDLQPTCERDRLVCQWLAQNKRSAYIPCFLLLQRDSPNVLGEFDDDELLSVFLGLTEQETYDPSADISSMLSGFTF